MGISKVRIDSRREVKPRFCSRYFVGATETLQNRKVVKRQNGPPERSVPTMGHTNSVGTGVLDGPKSRGDLQIFRFIIKNSHSSFLMSGSFIVPILCKQIDDHINDTCQGRATYENGKNKREDARRGRDI